MKTELSSRVPIYRDEVISNLNFSSEIASPDFVGIAMTVNNIHSQINIGRNK